MRLASTRSKALGVRIAIDDFGVGYSSLSYLQHFPVDILKIDRSFVEAIHTDGQAPAMVYGMLELARTLGLETIAEGIETNAQWESLARDGCVLGQGYLFGKAHDEPTAARLLDRQRRLDQEAGHSSRRSRRAKPSRRSLQGESHRVSR